MTFIAVLGLFRKTMGIMHRAKQNNPKAMHLSPFSRISFDEAPEVTEKKFVATYRAWFEVATKLRRFIMRSNVGDNPPQSGR